MNRIPLAIITLLLMLSHQAEGMMGKLFCPRTKVSTTLLTSQTVSGTSSIPNINSHTEQEGTDLFSRLPRELRAHIVGYVAGHNHVFDPYDMKHIKHVSRCLRNALTDVLNDEKYGVRLSIRGLNSNGLDSLLNRATDRPSEAHKVYELDCKDSDLISYGYLGALVKLFPNLKFLVLSRCQNITAARLGDIAQLKHLIKLNISWTAADDATLMAIVDSIAALERLNIRGCMNISAAGLRTIAQLTHLKQLDISYTHADDATLMAIVNNISDLERLNIRGCMNISAAGLRIIDRATQAAY